MKNLSEPDCMQLRQLGNVPLPEALAKALADFQVEEGLWRFFSDQYPNGGVACWNEDFSWLAEWGIPSKRLYAFGEDIFGNQLIIQPTSENTFLWNHENGDLFDLLLDPVVLLETVASSGLDWIDFYNDGSLSVARKKLMDVPVDCHLHWTTPLILGGKVTEDNVSVVERVMHLKGHAKLWRQLRGREPGTSVIVKPKQGGI